MSSFPEVGKVKGTNEVRVSWEKMPSLNKTDVVILDSVIASGDSVVALVNYIKERYPAVGKITVIGVYGAPEGLENVARKPSVNRMVIGVLSQSVDSAGYLQPPTHGDIGDKLFGSV
jgi:4a-hydroxytetrahydrobiopterin dehydratase